MRILHVSDCFLPRMGGIERQVNDLAHHQHAAGHEVEILTSVAGAPADGDSTIPVHRLASAHGKPRGTILYRTWLSGRRVARTGDYDVVHVHASSWSPMAFATARSAARAGIPVVVTLHSMWGRIWPLYALANRVLGWNRLPIVWTAVSSAATADLARHLRAGGHGGRREPVEVLPNAVDGDAWRIDPLPRAGHRVVIASVMRLAMRKRPRQYLRMLRRVRRLVPSDIALEVIIIGDGPRRAGLERYLAKHDMTDWVTLTGRATHEQIRELYRDADFFVAPATLESFGIAVLEARSAGLPIIAHAGSGVRDFVTHGYDGLLAKGDTDMVERIAQLVMSPKLRAKMTRHNRRTTPQLGWPEIMAQCEALYERAGYRTAAPAVDELTQQSA
jgi:glycosyltransferase involved in cell wall biosynthesis